MIASRTSSFCLLCLLLFCRAETDDVTGNRPNDSTCDATNEECNLPDADVANGDAPGRWQPFLYQSSSVWVSLDSVYAAYVRWHNKSLFDVDVPCEEKRVLVFTPNAGFGDSVGALSSAFYYAIKTGRMMFINWKPYHWTVGLKKLNFVYDYSKAKALLDPATGRPLLCVKNSNDPASFLEGHVTNQHAIVNEPIVNDYVSWPGFRWQHFSSEKMIETLLTASKKVEQIIQSVTDAAKKKEKDENVNIRTVAVVMRTGEGEYNQFLSKGDEALFVKCLRSYAKQVNAREGKTRFRVFVTSDSTSAKAKVIKELTQGDNGGLEIDVLSLNDSVIHLMHLNLNQGSDSTKELIKAKIRRTFAEFFLIGRCQVLFLTHGSLFGRVASERGNVPEADVHYISDSNCDGKREKYSYLTCHEPKYPDVCGFH